MRRIATVFLGSVLALTLATPAMAQDLDHNIDDDDLVVLTGGARLDEDQAYEDAVIFNGDVSVSGELRGDLVVFNGDVEISGSVGGDVVVFNGDVLVTSTATIAGDLASRRDPTVEDGGTVSGEIRSPSRDFFRPLEVFAAKVAFFVATTVSLLLLGLLLLTLAPRPMDSVATTWQSSKGKAALWGAILLFGLPIAAVLVMITVVGIPFGLGALLSLFFVYSIAYVTGAWAIGRSIVKAPSSRFLAFLAGFGVLRLIGLIPVAGGIISFLATVFGLGLLGVTIWRSRKGSEPAPAAA
jgi:hypothetical protein